MKPTCATCKRFLSNQGNCKKSSDPKRESCDEWEQAGPLDKYPKEILEIANKLLDEGDPFAFIVDTWNSMHVGDRGIGEACACAVGATYITNSNGLHMKPSGQSGKGKSDGSKKFVHLLPDSKKMVGSLSGKAPFYSKELKPGVVVYSDDAALNNDIASTIKQATTYFQTTTIHRTVSVKRKGEVLTIPPRISWWITNVDSFDDDQMGNRFLTMDVDAGKKQDEAVFDHQKRCHLLGRSPEDVTAEVLICRAIYDILNKNTYHIVVPFLNCIKWDNIDNRRNFQMFIDIMESVTLYQYRQREQIKSIYLSELQDYQRAKHIYNSLVATNTTNLSAIELDIMRYMEKEEYTNISDIAKKIKRGRTATHKYLHGKNGSSGLLEKVPGLDFEKVTIKQEGSDKSTHKNIYRYQADESKYGINSFDSVVGISLAGFEKEVSATRASLSSLSLTVSSLSPQKITVKTIPVDNIYNKYIINNKNIYSSEGESELLHNLGDSGDSGDSDEPDSESKGDSGATVKRQSKPSKVSNSQKQLMKDLKSFKDLNYRTTSKISYAKKNNMFLKQFIKKHDTYEFDQDRVISAIKEHNKRGWK